MDALTVYSENLCHADKQIRLATLRILCHYESLTCEDIHPAEKKRRTEVSEEVYEDERSSNVCNYFIRCCFPIRLPI